MLFFGASTSSAGAQESDVASAAANARFHWKALHFTPTLLLNNLGTDSNIFNAQGEPIRDFTLSVGPASDLWLNVGRSLISGRVAAQYNYFQKFEDQRNLNSSESLRWDVPLGRLTPFVAGSHAILRNRRSYEIDTRPRGTFVTGSVGASIRVSGKTEFVISGGRNETAYGRGETFRGSDLTSLNQETTFQRLQFRYRLTPLTTFVVDGQALQDRFPNAPQRSFDGYKILPGFEMKPAALISGSAFVGMRRLDPLTPAVPRFQGVIATADTRLINGSRLISVSVGRDVVPSYSIDLPYYILTDTNVSLTQRIRQSWDVTARGSWQALDYRAPSSEAASAEPRIDRVRLYGAGFGYRIGQSLRLGFNVIEMRRRSQVAQFDYTGVRMGISVEYGIGQ